MIIREYYNNNITNLFTIKPIKTTISKASIIELQLNFVSFLFKNKNLIYFYVKNSP